MENNGTSVIFNINRTSLFEKDVSRPIKYEDDPFEFLKELMKDPSAKISIEIFILIGILNLDVIKELEKSKNAETLLIEVIRNYIRKTNYLELLESLNDNEITENDFNKTIEDNYERYIIKLREIRSEEEAVHIVELMRRIGLQLRDFTLDEVAEMFSVKENQLAHHIHAAGNLLK
jgi:hypothetical protein